MSSSESLSSWTEGEKDSLSAMTHLHRGYCAIDFGTSNSAIAIAAPGPAAAMRLIELEPGQRTMPTAVFYAADGGLHEQPHCEFGRAAVAAYVDGIDGRLMRSMKSILGSSLIEQTTDVGGGRAVRYLDVVATYLRHLQARRRGRGRRRDRPRGARPAGVLRRRRSGARRPGRAGAAQRPRSAPAFARSSSSTSRSPPPSTTSRRCAARRRCWSPTSAAAPPTSRSSGSGPAAARQAERKADILANHGVHIAGTDFDRRVELASVLPLLGYRAFGAAQRRRSRRARCRARSTSTSRPGT